MLSSFKHMFGLYYWTFCPTNRLSLLVENDSVSERKNAFEAPSLGSDQAELVPYQLPMHPGRVIAYLSDWVHFQITRVQLWSYGLTKRSTPSKCSSRNVCFALFTPIFYFAGRRCTCCQSATPFTGGLAISTNPIPRSGLSIGDISLLRHLHQNNSAAGSN